MHVSAEANLASATFWGPVIAAVVVSLGASLGVGFQSDTIEENAKRGGDGRSSEMCSWPPWAQSVISKPM